MNLWMRGGGNPSSAHASGRAAAMAVDRARQQVADLVGWPRDGVVFTSGATEANALALASGRWAVSAVEHPSALAWGAVELPVSGAGIVFLDALASRLNDVSLTGVSVQMANNETGVIQPIAEIARLVRGQGKLLHVDAAQAPGRISLHALSDADFVSLSAHKFGGPQGVGALLFRPGLTPQPRLLGGPQERGWRAGTHNVAGIVGMGVAAGAALGQSLPSHLQDRLLRTIVGLGGQIVGLHAKRLPNTVAAGFQGVDAADLVVALDLAGVCVSAGSACASGSPKPSHVLRAMGFPGSAVRFSVGATTTESEIDVAMQALRACLWQMRPVG